VPGSQVRSSDIFPHMPMTLPRVPDGCICFFLPHRQRPSPQTYRVGEYPAPPGSSLKQALPAINACCKLTRLHHSFSYYGLRVWLAPPTGYDALCVSRGTLSGQVPPGCYHPNAPPAYTPVKASGVAFSFQSARYQFHNLVHVILTFKLTGGQFVTGRKLLCHFHG